MKRLPLIIVFVLKFATPAWVNIQAGAVAFIAPRRCLAALLLVALVVMASCAPGGPTDSGMGSYDEGVRAYNSGDFTRVIGVRYLHIWNC